MSDAFEGTNPGLLWCEYITEFREQACSTWFLGHVLEYLFF